MDDRMFDRIARILGGAATRRAGVQAALGGALGLAALEVAPASGRGGGRKGGKGKGDGGGGRAKPAGPCGDGSREANLCTKDRQCCTGFCKGKNNGNGRCRCLQRGKPCKTGQTCCNNLACQSGVCGGTSPMPGSSCSTSVTCGAGMACSSGVCKDIEPCPSPFTSGMWGMFDIAYNYENKGEGKYPGTLDQPIRFRLMPDGASMLVVDQANRLQKFDIYTYALTGYLAAPMSGNKAEPPAGSGDGEFDAPKDVYVSPNGSEAYVIDSGNSRVSVINPVTMTPIRQIPVTQDALPPSLTLEQAFVCGALDSANNRIIMSLYADLNSTAYIGYVPLDGSAQSLVTLPTNNGYRSIEVNADGSRIYVAGMGAVAILDAQLQQVAILGTFSSTFGDWSCPVFGSIASPNTGLLLQQNTRLWVSDYGCRRVVEYDVSNDQFTVLTWTGGTDETQYIAPLIRPDGVMVLANHDDDDPFVDVRCRNSVPTGQLWRSSTSAARRHSKAGSR